MRGIVQQAIQALLEANNAKSKERKAQNRATNWTAGATVAMAVFAFVSTGVGIAQWVIQSRTLDEIKGQQRAWVITGDIAFELVRPGVHVLSVEAKNVGVLPATSGAYDINVPNVLPLLPKDIPNFKAGPNNVCNGIKPPKAGFGFVMHPGMDRHMYAEYTGYQNVTANQTVVIKGCVVYRTLGEIRKSPFCWFTLPEDKPLADRKSRYCDQGNEPT